MMSNEQQAGNAWEPDAVAERIAAVIRQRKQMAEERRNQERQVQEQQFRERQLQRCEAATSQSIQAA